MSDGVKFYSDGRCESSPTIFELMWMTPEQLLYMSIPEKALKIAPRQPIVEEYVNRPELRGPLLCLQCGSQFFTQARKTKAGTCSVNCASLYRKARDAQYKAAHAEQRKAARQLARMAEETV